MCSCFVYKASSCSVCPASTVCFFKPYSSTVCAAGTGCVRTVTSDYVTGSRRTSLDCSAHSCKICACRVSFDDRQTDSSSRHDFQGSCPSDYKEGSSAECRYDCNRKSCGVPVAIDNADHMLVNPAMLEETFAYECYSGYSLEGSSVGALDTDAAMRDVETLFVDSQECWPADDGDYGPFFVRLEWYCPGSCREKDGSGGGTGGRQCFEPGRGWADNTNLDKARALLRPIKQEYGESLSY